MKTKIFSIIIIILFAITNNSHSQYLESEPNKWERIFYGGNLGLNFGTTTIISLNPTIGYRLTNRLSTGLGGYYIFMDSKTYNTSYSFYGYSLFASYNIFKGIGDYIPFASEYTSILLYGEYNIMNIKDFSPVTNNMYQENPMIGIAFQTQYSKRAYLVFKILYNLNESLYSIFPNPVIKVSMQF
jgi:hypothetical protein